MPNPLALVAAIAMTAGVAQPRASETRELDTASLLAELDEPRVLAAIRDLRAIRTSHFAGPLAWLATGHGSSAVRTAAVSALAALDWPASASELDARVQLFGRLLDAGDTALRHAAIDALGEVPLPLAAQLLTAHEARAGVSADDVSRVRAALLRQRSPTVLQRLATALAPREPLPPPAPVLLHALTLLGAPDGEAGQAALTALLELAPTRRSFIRFAARAGGPATRARALGFLAEHPLPEDRATLVLLLTHLSSTTRAGAVTALAASGDDAAKLLAEHLAIETSDEVLDVLARALARSDEPRIGEWLEPVLRGPDGRARLVAVGLVRARAGVEYVWPKVLALAATNATEDLTSLRVEAADARRRALAPRLAESPMAPALQIALVQGLEGAIDAEHVPAVLALLAPESSAALFAAMARAVSPADDEALVARLAELRPQASPERRAQIDALLAAATSPTRTAALVAALDSERDPELVRGLLDALPTESSPEALAAVHRYLDSREPSVVVRAALGAVSRAGDEASSPRITELVLALGAREAATPREDSHDPGLAADAYRALLTQPESSVVPELRRLVVVESLAPSLRLAAVNDLGRLGTSDDQAVLLPLRTHADRELRKAVRRALHEVAPRSYVSYDTRGRLPLVGTAAAYGATLLWLTTELADAEQRKTLLTGGGAILGGSTAYLLTLDSDLSLGEAGYFATLGLWSTLAGHGAAAVAGAGADRDARLWSAVAGELVGLGAGWATLRDAHFETADVLLTNALAVSLGVGALSAAKLAGAEDGIAGPLDVFALGAAAAVLPMAYLSPRLSLDAHTWASVGFGVTWGSWLGAFAPLALTRDATGEDVLAGAGVGQALGFASGLALGNLTRFDDRAYAWLSLGALAGASAGAGLGLVRDDLDERGTYAGLELGTLAAGGLFAWLGPKLVFRETDLALVGLATAGGAVSGARWVARTAELGNVPGVEQEASTSELWGGGMLGGSLGLGLGLWTSQFVDLTPAQLALTGVAAGAFGVGASAFSLMTPGLDSEEHFSPLFSMGAAAGGLAMAFASPHLRYSASDAGLALSASALGLGLGTTLPAHWTAESRALSEEHRVGGAMLGASLGFVGAGALSQLVELEPTHVLKIDLAALAGVAAGAGLGLLDPSLDRGTTAALMQAGGLGAFVAAGFTERAQRYDGNDAARFVLATGVGALAGGLVPMVRADARELAPEQTRGGVLLGASLGFFSARAAVQAQHLGDADLVEAALWTTLGASLGAGAWSLDAGGARERALSLQLASVLGLVGGELLAPRTQYSDDDYAWVMTAGALGTWLGAWGPRAAWGADATAPQAASGALIGGSGGLLLGMAATQLFEARADEAYETLGLAAGTASFVAGLARLGVPARHDAQAWLAQGAVIGALGAGSLLSPHTPQLDPITLGAFAALGSWHGAWMTPLVGRRMSDDLEGGVLVGAGAGALVGYALDPFTELPADELGEMLSGATLGSLFAGGLAAVTDATTPDQALALQVGSALGAALGLGVAPHTHYGDRDIPLLAAGALWGAWTGGIAGAGFGPERVAIEARVKHGAMAGAGLGLGAAAIGAQRLELDAGDVVEGSFWLGAGNLTGLGAARLLGSSREQRFALVEAGGALGIAAGLWFAPTTRYEDDDGYLVALTSTVGTLHGAMLPLAWRGEADASDDEVDGGVFLGLGLGVAGGLFAASRLSLDAADVAEVALMTTSGELLGTGLAEWLDLDSRHGALLVHATGLGLFGAGLWSSQRSQYDSSARLFIGYGAVYGAWLGRVLPNAWGASPTSDDRPAGSLLGLAMGALGAGAATQLADYTNQDVAEIAATSVLATSVGGGLGLVLSDDSAWWTQLGGGLGLVGTALGAAYAEDVTLTARDTGLGTLAGLYGLYQGAGLSLLARGTEQQTRGAMLATSAGGALLGAYFGRALRLDATDMLMLAAGSAWGLWLGGWTAAVLDESSESATGADRTLFELGIGTTAVATDVALVATSLAISRLVDMSPKRFAWISVGGGMGLVLGTAVAASVPEASLRRGVLFGSLAGLAGATLVTGLMDLDARERERAAAGPPRYPEDSDAARAGLWPKIDTFFPSVGPAPSLDPGRPAASDGMLFTVTGMYR